MKTYVVDSYKLLDYIQKNNIKDVFQVEMYIRNHSYYGGYEIKQQEFKERDDLHFHLQAEASKIEIRREDNGNEDAGSEI